MALTLAAPTAIMQALQQEQGATMSHPCEVFADTVLAGLAAQNGEGPVENDQRLVPGLYVSWDDDKGKVTLRRTAEKEATLGLTARITQAPRWITLNIDLGPGRFEPGDILGLAADLESDRPLRLDAFVRSAGEDGHEDSRLPDALNAAPGGVVQTSLLTVHAAHGLTRNSRFHTLVFRLPDNDFSLTLRGFQLFVLPAGRGLQTGSLTLADASG